MPRGIPADRTHKAEIVAKIRDHGLSVSEASAQYQYDKNGNLIDRTETAGQTLYTYDGFNRVTQLKQYSQPNLDYTYDKAGNLKTEAGAAGTATYSYDAANQVTGVKHSATGTNNYSVAYTAGRPTTVTLPGGITQTISYDKAGRQTSIKAVKGSTVLTNYTASYANTAGADNQLMQTEKDNVTGITTTYSYDGLERLVGAAGSGNGAHSYTYAYDANGNRTQSSKDGVYSAIYGYNNANQLTTAGGATYGGYDAAGNQTSNGAGLTMTYTAQNQATSFTPKGATTQNASYLNAGQTSRTAFGAITYQNGLQGMYSEKAGSTTTGYVHLPGGTKQTIYQLIGTTPYYYLTDIHGSTVKMTNASGTVVNTYNYDPYGKQLTATGSTQNKIKYSNGYQDTTTGLYKYGARYYNVVEGRWTQMDPSGNNAHYVYGGNNPINNADPSGLAYGNLGISGCLVVCIDAGILADKTDIHPYAGLGVGVDAGVDVGFSANEGSISSGLQGSLNCDLLPIIVFVRF